MAGRNLLANPPPEAAPAAPAAQGRNLLSKEGQARPAPSLSSSIPRSSTEAAVAATVPKRKPTDLTTSQRLRGLASEGAVGGIVGAVMPEILTGAGMLAAPTPLAPISPWLMLTGRAMRGARMASAAAGAYAGATGEFLAQEAEMKGYGKAVQEGVRLVGGAVAPEFTRPVKQLVQAAFNTIARTGGTSAATADVMSVFTQQTGIPEESLSKAQREYIARVADDIRRGVEKDARENLYSALGREVQKSASDYADQAAMFERQARDVMDAASASSAAKTADAVSRVDAMNKQLNEYGTRLLGNARNHADRLVRDANRQADFIRSQAQKSAPEARKAAEAKADRLVLDAENEATRIVTAAQDSISKARSRAAALQQRASRSVAEGRAPVAAAGEAKPPSQTGGEIRKLVVDRFEKLKEVRANAAKTDKAEAFTSALAREKGGETVASTRAFKTLLKDIDNAIVNPETGLVNVSVPQMQSQLSAVKNALQPESGKVSFEGMENLRRFLRDRSYGLPAEGYDSISQQQAGQLADGIEAAMAEFSPRIKTFLENYRANSEPLRVFKSKLGKSVVENPEFDWGRFVTDESQLAGRFFKSKQSVADLRELLGKDSPQAERVARSWVADQLQGKSGSEVATKLREWRDWLPSFPALNAELADAVKAMTRGETFGAARQRAAGKLRTEARAGAERLPAVAEKADKLRRDATDAAAKLRQQGMEAEAKLLESAEKEASAAVAAGRKNADAMMNNVQRQVDLAIRKVEGRARSITAEAARTGRREVAAATQEAAALRQEAGKLTQKSQELANLVLSNKATKKRVQEIILSGDKNLWQTIAPMVNQDPRTKELFKMALRQVVADISEGAPRSMKNTWDLQLREFVETNNLLTPKQISTLDSQLEAINRAVDIPEPRKLKLMDRLIVRAIGITAARPPMAVIGAIQTSSDRREQRKQEK